MKCQRCDEREATIQIVQKHMDGKEETIFLCARCAKELGLSVPTFSGSNTADSTPFSLFTDFFQQYFGLAGPEWVDRKTEKCQSCGTSIEEFRQTGLFGCQRCYESFSDQLEPIFGKMQMGSLHKGRVLGKIVNIDPTAASAPSAPDGADAKRKSDAGAKKRESTASKDEKISGVKDSKGKKTVQKKSVDEDTESPAQSGLREKEDLLRKAVEEENYIKAAQLRDELRKLRNEVIE